MLVRTVRRGICRICCSIISSAKPGMEMSYEDPLTRADLYFCWKHWNELREAVSVMGPILVNVKKEKP